MNYKKFKKILYKFKCIPIHPQWFVFKGVKDKNREISKWVFGKVLDIGCADSNLKNKLPETVFYVGLDYYETAMNLYNTTPDIFGDAHALPFLSQSFDSILLLDVLEHLHDPIICIEEVKRVLKPGGIFYLQVPFMYPEHDAPFDYQRWTHNGLRWMVDRHAFEICLLKSLGKPIETATLFVNIALVKTWFNWIRQKKPLLIVGILLPFIVFFLNILGFVIAKFSPEDGMMAHGHTLVLRKRA